MSPIDRKLLDDCFLHDKDRLPHGEAISLLRERLSCISEVEAVPLGAAVGRILAETIMAPNHVPAADNAAVDGYAYNSADYVASNGKFPVIARIAAGDLAPVSLQPGSAARIFTGAVMPMGADTVAMQEDCEAVDQDGSTLVQIPAGLKPGANRRKAGEDLAAGTIIASPGERITPIMIAAFSSCGLSEISTFKPLRIAILSSGNELREPGKLLPHPKNPNTHPAAQIAAFAVHQGL